MTPSQGTLTPIVVYVQASTMAYVLAGFVGAVILLAVIVRKVLANRRRKRAIRDF
jgi:uncharacterized membrane protein YeaQ/YmgE (transglycosylase-associated protein family)